MVIKQVLECSNPGMIKVSAEEGAAFFVRKEYLFTVDFDSIYAGKIFDNEEQVNELLDAGLASAAEIKAISYLARCEQNRMNLGRKLCEKGFEKKYVEMALDYLELKNYLSDLRFATAWLNSRKINHYEGRTKLLSELLSRGIGRENANKALDEFFEENDEEEICQKAFEKLKRKGKSDEKLIAAMMQSGFSYKQVTKLLYSD